MAKEMDEHLENYDFSLSYHLGKTNVVAMALSRKSTITVMFRREWEFLEVINSFGLKL